MTESRNVNVFPPMNGEVIHKSNVELNGHAPHTNGKTETFVLEEDDEYGSTAATKPSIFQDSIARIAFRNAMLIASWYILSCILSVYNKKLIGKNYGIFGEGGFPAPLLFSSLQFTVQHLCARMLLSFNIVKRSNTEPISREDYYRSVVPNGIATGLDIGLSVYSLRFISLSFYTMCKSTVPLFLMFFAIAMGLEKFTCQMAMVGATITPGLVLLVIGEKKFDLLGFILVMLASAMSGLRWAITQVQLQGRSQQNGESRGGHHGAPGGMSAIEVLEQLTPVAAVTVGVLSLIVEQLWVSLPTSTYFATPFHTMVSTCLMVSGGLLAFFMVWVEFRVIAVTSALTLIVAGVFKEILTVVAGVLFFEDLFHFINGVGLVVVISGVILYNFQKYKKLKSGELVPAHKPSRKLGEEAEGEEELVPLRDDVESNNVSPVAPTKEYMATKKRSHDTNNVQ